MGGSVLTYTVLSSSALSRFLGLFDPDSILQ